MTREDAKDLTLSILVIVAVLLAADNLWLHTRFAALEQKIELHINPPLEPTMKERAKAAYDKTKAAMKRGYEKVKETFNKKENPTPAE